MCFIFIKDKQYFSSVAGIGLLDILQKVTLLTKYAPSEDRLHGGKQKLLTGRHLVVNATAGRKEDEASE